MLVLIRTCDWQSDRYAWALELHEQLAGHVDVELVLDETRDAMDTFESALDRQAGQDAWHIEDDIVLTEGFVRKARALELEHRSRVIQGFSRRSLDLTVGSRLELAATFIHHQCFYVPGRLAPDLRAYSPEWRAAWRPGRPSGGMRPFTDTMMRDFLRSRRLRYWVVCPNLAQHRDVDSLLGNPAHRQSFSFAG